MGKVIPYGQRFNRKTKKYEDISKIGMPEWFFKYPDGFVLVRDTREQTGLFQKPPKGLIIMRDTLTIGDYSIKGFEKCIAVERKNVNDLWSSVTIHAEAFKDKMVTLSKYERKWILIDGLESEYLAFHPDRKLHPNQIRQALASIEGRLGIPVHQSEGIESSERWMIDVFIKFYLQKRGL